MKVIKVKKGNHYPSNMFRWFPLFYCKNKTIAYNIKFTNESFFQFEGSDLYDYSKLFGISFGHHHKNESYRFGFRMLNETEINISLYYYINGKKAFWINYNSNYIEDDYYVYKSDFQPTKKLPIGLQIYKSIHAKQYALVLKINKDEFFKITTEIAHYANTNNVDEIYINILGLDYIEDTTSIANIKNLLKTFSPHIGPFTTNTDFKKKLIKYFVYKDTSYTSYKDGPDFITNEL